MKLIPLPALTDNYIWLLHDGHQALAVDPGVAEPVLAALRHNRLQLAAILVTHHHADHTAGIDALRIATGAKVLGPALESIPGPIQHCTENDKFSELNLHFTVMQIPGHTADHLAYYCPDVDGEPLVFCGDTLFSAGCGRLFEGTPAQMQDSLQRLAALPANTRICCAHEYTLSNLRFARAVEPANIELMHYQQHCEQLRQNGLPTVPTRLDLEWQINPFLRCHVPAVRAATQQHNAALAEQSGIFAGLRQWKNDYR